MAVAPAHGGERRSQSHYRRCCGTTRCLGADRSFQRCRAAAARRRRRPPPPRNWWQACGRGCEMAPLACTAGRARRARRALERSYYIGSCASTWLEFFGSVEWLYGAWQRVVECFNACQRRRRKTLTTWALAGQRLGAHRFKLCLKRSRINHAAPEHHQPADRFSGPGPPFVHRLQKEDAKDAQACAHAIGAIARVLRRQASISLSGESTQGESARSRGRMCDVVRAHDV